jgi:hypothetical protein
MWEFEVNPIRNEEVGVKKYQILEKKLRSRGTLFWK